MSYTVWSPLQYGWHVVYWLTIEGIDDVFVESATGLTLPSGYNNEVAALVIDDSAPVGSEVDIHGGVGKSLPLTFRLQDTAEVRGWFTKWSNSASLTQQHTSSVATITVDSTTGFDGSGTIWIGNERITYTGTTATTFTTATRGTVGYSYPHKYGTATGIVTDKPRYWQGREVKLYASPVDQTGFVSGAALATDASLIWRGHIERGPWREGLHFAFDAQALDRRLARKIGQKFSGIIVDTEQRYAVSRDAGIWIHIVKRNSSHVIQFNEKFVVRPFLMDTTGDMLTGDQIRARIVSGYEQTVSALGLTAGLDSIVWIKKGFTGVTDPKLAQTIYVANFTFDAVASARTIEIAVAPDGGLVTPTSSFTAQTIGAGNGIASHWVTTDNPMRQTLQGAQPLGKFAALQLVEGDPAAVPTTGCIKIGEDLFRYEKATSTQGVVHLAWLTSVGAASAAVVIAGAEASIIASDGTLAAPSKVSEAANRMIASSAETGLRSATYDTLLGGQGYGLDESMVDADSIATTLNDGLMGQMRVAVAPDDESFEDIFGGLLQLSSRAVVARPDLDDSTDFVLTAIDVSIAADYSTTITDADLLARGGNPANMERPDDWPNHIKMVAQQAGEDVFRVAFVDDAAVSAQGRREMDLTVPMASPGSLLPAATAWAMQLFSGATSLQILRIRVGAWVQAEVGDSVLLSLTHPALWQWDTGAPGFAGVGRVIGRSITLKTGEVELKLLAAGAASQGALSPAAACLATDSTTAPTYIDVPGKYLKHFGNAVTAAGGNVRILHYRPGQANTVSDGYTYSAAAANGSNCRLTIIATKIGTPTLVVTGTADPAVSYLTLPESANDDAYQARFMHDADGSEFK